MSQAQYSHLFSSVKIGNISLKNRIMTSGHQTSLAENHLPTEDFIAYHTERAKGGVGLIVMEAHGVHKTGLNTPLAIDASDPKIVEIHRRTASNVHHYGGKLLAQLIHHGREAYVSEENNDVVAPSAVPTERFHIIPRELEHEEIEEIIDGFVKSALHLKQAGIDGVEFVGSHTYLFEQFWSNEVNKRKDKWGGSFENRMRFSREVMRRVREAVGKDFVIGMRMSLNSQDSVGTSGNESLEVIRHLHELGILDYWSLVIGSSATYKGSSYIVPPANESTAQLFIGVKEVRAIIGKMPLIITSRIYTPAGADQLIEEQHADIVGMTRALIADPHMPNKVLQEDEEAIVPCIACNQGCIGRYQEHLPIRCTVNPITGRERKVEYLQKPEVKQRIAVIGGGPSGMMAALTLARQGHEVTLFEKSNRLGGQLNIIAGALHREQVLHWRSYLINNMKRLKVNIKTNAVFALDENEMKQFDGVIIATGSKPMLPEISEDSAISAYTTWEIFDEEVFIQEQDILVLDWKGDWPGSEAAALMASRGKNVEIVSQTYGIAEAMQQYKRNKVLEQFDRMDVKQTPHYKFLEMKKKSVVLEHIFSGRQEERSPEAVVFSIGQEASDSLEQYRKLKNLDNKVIRIGDARSPRTLDEAVWEGFQAAREFSTEAKEEIIHG